VSITEGGWWNKHKGNGATANDGIVAAGDRSYCGQRRNSLTTKKEFSEKDFAMMSRRLPGSLLLILLLLGLGFFYANAASAGSNGAHSANVMVRVSPLALLVQNEVTVKVGEYTCNYVNGIEAASVCWDLPPGDYEVSATSDGYIVLPPVHNIKIQPDSNIPVYFRLYQNNHQLYVPNVQVEP
jgi:hypothetical protein